MKDSGKAIIRTIIYSDLFDFPLKKNELWYFMKSSHEIAKEDFLWSIQRLPESITVSNGYYHLANRKHLPALRKKREGYSRKKYAKAKKAVYWLSVIPTISYIGISGSVAYGNADESDDIDFFIIVQKNTLWVSRLMSLLLLQILGLRRQRGIKDEENKICINMMITEEQLALPENRRDTYTAHEVAQLRPVYDKKGLYRKFIHANNWIQSFMPNVLYKQGGSNARIPLLRSGLFSYIEKNLFTISFFVPETLSRVIQLWQINKHKTTETVSDVLLAFHPNDYRRYVLSQYRKRLKAYHVNGR